MTCKRCMEIDAVLDALWDKHKPYEVKTITADTVELANQYQCLVGDTIRIRKYFGGEPECPS